MAVIRSQISTSSEAFRANSAAMAQAMRVVEDAAAVAVGGGGEVARERHVSRGKMLPRERVAQLIDPATPFLEVGMTAAHGLYQGEAPGAGLVTGIGRVSGRDCMIVCNDATVKGGTYYPMTVKKHLRAQEIAAENNLPCIYLVDSGGANLPNQDEVFPDRDHFGRIFYNQANMSAAGIPQIAVVMGSCTAGGAYVPAMSDEAIIVEGQGTIFLAGPPLVRAATGEVVSSEDLGGGDVHTRLSGVADHLACDDAHALALARRAVANLNRIAIPTIERQAPEEPHYPATDRTVSSRSTAQTVRRSRSDRADGRWQRVRRIQGALRHDAGLRLRPYPRHEGRHHRQQRHPVFGVGAEGRALHRAVLPAQDSAGVPAEHHRLHGRAQIRERGHRAHGAKLVTAVATTGAEDSPCMVGGSFGAGNYGMCGRAFSPRFLWMWPNSRASR
jgi:3-methylcrotonyl-CoA carboxylase beta subunit